MRSDFIVVGAGPAGVSAALGFSKKGFRVTIVEVNKNLALKPCGNGLVKISDIPFQLPRSAFITKIRRGLLYVDGEIATEIKGEVEGYIIDKKKLLNELIARASSDLYLNAFFDPYTLKVKLKGDIIELDRKRTIIAGGHPFYTGEKIFAVETILRPRGPIDENEIEIWFDTKLIGYYWVFPADEGKVQVGVGGYANPEQLIMLLKKFICNDRRFSCNNILIRGSYIAVGGVRFDTFKGILKIGESSGFVMPLTGEGIRPSMLSGYHTAIAIAEGRDPFKEIKKLHIVKAIDVQRRILERVKSMPIEKRRKLLKSIPAEVHAEVALGSLRRSRIIKALASRPDLLKSILRLI
jgi:digeranylgeranylglycerophospholipid reductase